MLCNFNLKQSFSYFSLFYFWKQVHCVIHSKQLNKNNKFLTYHCFSSLRTSNLFSYFSFVGFQIQSFSISYSVSFSLFLLKKLALCNASFFTSNIKVCPFSSFPSTSSSAGHISRRKRERNVKIEKETWNYIVNNDIGRPRNALHRRMLWFKMKYKNFSPIFLEQMKPRMAKKAATLDENNFPAAVLPEIAFTGRSNCGKSTLLNELVGRHCVANVNKKPGSTQLIHFFQIGSPSMLVMVDMPGYGYAYNTKEEKVMQYTESTLTYLKNRKNLKKVFVLVDSRQGLKNGDREMISFLERHKCKWQVVLTKCDLTKQTHICKRIQLIREEIKEYKNGDLKILAVSALKKQGLDVLRNIINNYKLDKFIIKDNIKIRINDRLEEKRLRKLEKKKKKREKALREKQEILEENKESSIQNNKEKCMYDDENENIAQIALKRWGLLKEDKKEKSEEEKEKNLKVSVLMDKLDDDDFLRVDNLVTNMYDKLSKNNYKFGNNFLECDAKISNESNSEDIKIIKNENFILKENSTILAQKENIQNNNNSDLKNSDVINDKINKLNDMSDVLYIEMTDEINLEKKNLISDGISKRSEITKKLNERKTEKEKKPNMRPMMESSFSSEVSLSSCTNAITKNKLKEEESSECEMPFKSFNESFYTADDGTKAKNILNIGVGESKIEKTKDDSVIEEKIEIRNIAKSLLSPSAELYQNELLYSKFCMSSDSLRNLTSNLDDENCTVSLGLPKWRIQNNEIISNADMPNDSLNKKPLKTILDVTNDFYKKRPKSRVFEFDCSPSCQSDYLNISSFPSILSSSTSNNEVDPEENFNNQCRQKKKILKDIQTSNVIFQKTSARSFAFPLSNDHSDAAEVSFEWEQKNKQNTHKKEELKEGILNKDDFISAEQKSRLGRRNHLRKSKIIEKEKELKNNNETDMKKGYERTWRMRLHNNIINTNFPAKNRINSHINMHENITRIDVHKNNQKNILNDEDSSAFTLPPYEGGIYKNKKSYQGKFQTKSKVIGLKNYPEIPRGTKKWRVLGRRRHSDKFSTPKIDVGTFFGFYDENVYKKSRLKKIYKWEEIHNKFKRWANKHKKLATMCPPPTKDVVMGRYLDKVKKRLLIKEKRDKAKQLKNGQIVKGKDKFKVKPGRKKFDENEIEKDTYLKWNEQIHINK